MNFKITNGSVEYGAETILEEINIEIKEKEKITKPHISEDETNEFEKTIIDAYYMQDKIHITYYKKGYTYEYYGLIKKIDSSNKLIYLNNLKLLFNQITGVTDTK